MAWNAFFGLALVCVFGAISPGPSLVVILRHCRVGPKAGVVAALGHGAAVFFYALLVVLGLYSLLLFYPKLVPAMQVLGAVWLLKIAYGLIWPNQKQSPEVAQPPLHRQQLSAAFDGFAIAFLNPKIALFMLALFSQWLYVGQPLHEKLVMALLAAGIDAAWYLLVALVLSQQAAQRLLQARWVDQLLALILSALALFVILNFLLFSDPV